MARSLDDIETRKALSSTAMKAFIGIMDTWTMTIEERCAILGGFSEETYHAWVGGNVGTLTYDQLQRIGQILGIYRGLCLLFSDEYGRMRWLESPNHDHTFQGKSP